MNILLEHKHKREYYLNTKLNTRVNAIRMGKNVNEDKKK